MIQGIKIKKLQVHQDIPDVDDQTAKPGYLMEVLRNDDELLKKFGQTIFTVAYEGTIKAFHWHKKQDDLWFIATGQAIIVLYDNREGSPTKGETQVIKAGEGDYKLVLIPVGVAHGYKVISKEPVHLFYHTTEVYNADDPDEERLPYNDKKINFNWNKY